MNELLAILLRDHAQALPWAEAATITFLRVGAAMAMLPGLGEQSIPARVRLALSLLLTIALTPSTLPLSQGADIAASFLPEVLVGLTLGLALRFFVFALSTAGAIIANSTSLAQLFSPGVEPQPALSQYLVLGGIALALSNDLLPRLVAFLLLSYGAFPPGTWPDAGRLAQWMAHHADTAFSLGFRLALPFALASLLYNLALGVINRAMPQLMVTFIGAPALSLGGLALLAIATPFVLAVWLQAFNAFLGTPAAP